MTEITYPTRYQVDMEVFVHSHYETGRMVTWDLVGIKCDTWLPGHLLEVLTGDKEWREDQLEHFSGLSLDDASAVTVTIDGDHYGSGWEWWIDNLTPKTGDA